eukprot:CAMPEP_0176471454 /NCGR_PEP_ID=MMETSP0127-20121128/41138_1 /TAXON_ID=938130 /ORGANISM="Platyophrya macrostoma, Strain WH" /LENGTH=144 /DNA_ID=CAMNT_0017866097 /DNA_START=14 /DNA_END=446 /DNA_ORIENTATION=-
MTQTMDQDVSMSVELQHEEKEPPQQHEDQTASQQREHPAVRSRRTSTTSLFTADDVISFLSPSVSCDAAMLLSIVATVGCVARGGVATLPTDNSSSTPYQDVQFTPSFRDVIDRYVIPTARAAHYDLVHTCTYVLGCGAASTQW